MRERSVKIYNNIKTNDWSFIQDEFEAVNKMVEKSKMLIIKEGLPKFYIKMLADLEDHLAVTLKDKELQKKMKPVVIKALNRMKLSVRKHNKNYEELISDFRSNPEKYAEAQSESDSDSDSSDDSSDDDSDSDSSDSDSRDSSEEEDLNAKPKPASKQKSKVIIFSFIFHLFYFRNDPLFLVVEKYFPSEMGENYQDTEIF
jgi:translation initiation factor 3 subunit C